MVIKEFYRVREDGVKLYINVDVKVNDKGEPLRDENGELIRTGFKIKQNETGVDYPEAVDVENAPYTYTETDKLIEVEEEQQTYQNILQK